MANGSQQIAIFYVFLGFFVLIGVASLAALLGFVRVLGNKHVQQGSYQIVCGGAEHVASGQTMACRNVTSDQSEGYVKTPGHNPPILYSVTNVAGDLMTVRTFSDQAHQHQIAALVYVRVP